MPWDSWIPRGANIAQPVHPFEPGAIAEMEARDGIGETLRAARAGQISRAQAQKRAAQRFCLRRVLPPPLRLQRGEQGGLRLLAGWQAVFSSQRRKRRTGDKVEKRVNCGSSARSSSTTCLIRKLPNETPRSPS